MFTEQVWHCFEKCYAKQRLKRRELAYSLSLVLDFYVKVIFQSHLSDQWAGCNKTPSLLRYSSTCDGAW